MSLKGKTGHVAIKRRQNDKVLPRTHYATTGTFSEFVMQYLMVVYTSGKGIKVGKNVVYNVSLCCILLSIVPFAITISKNTLVSDK